MFQTFALYCISEKKYLVAYCSPSLYICSQGPIGCTAAEPPKTLWELSSNPPVGSGCDKRCEVRHLETPQGLITPGQVQQGRLSDVEI